MPCIIHYTHHQIDCVLVRHSPRATRTYLPHISGINHLRMFFSFHHITPPRSTPRRISMYCELDSYTKSKAEWLQVFWAVSIDLPQLAQTFLKVWSLCVRNVQPIIAIFVARSLLMSSFMLIVLNILSNFLVRASPADASHPNNRRWNHARCTRQSLSVVGILFFRLFFVSSSRTSIASSECQTIVWILDVYKTALPDGNVVSVQINTCVVQPWNSILFHALHLSRFNSQKNVVTRFGKYGKVFDYRLSLTGVDFACNRLRFGNCFTY